MNAKTHYTHKELTRRSTAQLIAIYNRLFNDNAWDVWFNPFEHRQDMLLALYEEMVAQDIVARFVKSTEPVEKYKAMKIVVSEKGMAIIWNTGEIKTSGCKRTPAQMALIRSLAADGETQKFIAEALGIPKIAVFHVLKGAYALEPNRWNTKPEAPEQVKPVRRQRSTFRAARGQQPVFQMPAVRPNNEFWTAFGL